MYDVWYMYELNKIDICEDKRCDIYYIIYCMDICGCIITYYHGCIIPQYVK